jgi:hypothetical protein
VEGAGHHPAPPGRPQRVPGLDSWAPLYMLPPWKPTGGLQPWRLVRAVDPHAVLSPALPTRCLGQLHSEKGARTNSILGHHAALGGGAVWGGRCRVAIGL